MERPPKLGELEDSIRGCYVSCVEESRDLMLGNAQLDGANRNGPLDFLVWLLTDVQK